MDTKEKLITRIDHVISLGDSTQETSRASDFGTIVDYGLMRKFVASGKSLLISTVGKKHPYYEEFHSATDDNVEMSVKAGIYIIESLRYEVENGWLNNLKGIVSSEIFTDFLEMAEHLLERDYKDPAAVMIGSVLEEHLRQLCIKNDIPASTWKKEKVVPLNANTLNTELAKKGAINSFDLKSITAQLDIRNDAAHGNWSKYDKKQVQMMYDYVLNFLSRNPL